MALHTETVPSPAAGFCHEALLYEGDADFVDGTARFVQAGLDHDEPTLVAVSSQRIALLRDRLGSEADQVEFVDMVELGHNPARIIPAWREFLDVHGRHRGAVRGVGEPIWSGRSAAELVECQRHEALLNVAFDGSYAFSLMCPYDVSELPETVIAEALRTHPLVLHDGVDTFSEASAPHEMADAFLDIPLPEPMVPFREMEFGFGELHSLRSLVTAVARRTAMGYDRCYDLVLALSEIATNSVIHGGGNGIFRIWVDERSVVCEIRDQGQLNDPLVGREQPPVDGFGQRGLWMVNQLCDLVQIRVFPSGTVVRLHMAIA